MKLDPIERLDSVDLRTVVGHFPSGVAAICALSDDGPIGLAASSFTSVSLDPPLVSVCVQHTSQTWPLLRAHQRLGVSVLAEGQDVTCRSLASKAGPRFADVAWSNIDGAVFIEGASAWLSCRVHDEVPAGDHDIALLRIEKAGHALATEPLVFHGSTFRRLQRR